ncbi:nuclear factor of kappa light polypeptide gene enhancer in B-cells inhibitor-like 1, isoform CRA_b [Mus musculus]|nr:nuclear factor of kappa light polypeptide gene enhancer in B-cells inhibitor-like 1, isoform CRA_b [Mus musculus]
MSNPSPQAPEEEASTSVCRPQSCSMASASRRHRRERRFRRYLSAGRLVRAQALLQTAMATRRCTLLPARALMLTRTSSCRC